MLIAFLALIAMVNGMLGFFHTSLEQILGTVFMRRSRGWRASKFYDRRTIGNLLGTRLVLNEFVAFQQLGPMKPQIDPHSFTIATYALCGFANLSSIAIQIGGIWSAGAEPQIRSGAHGTESGGGGNHGEFYVGVHRGHASVGCTRLSDAIRSVTAREPRVAVVLGSGLGAFSPSGLADRVAIPYSDIPGWPVSTAAGHSGKLVFGKLGELDVAVMAGRAHLYEGYTPAQVTLGVRVLHRLGVCVAWCLPMPQGALICHTGKVRWCSFPITSTCWAIESSDPVPTTDSEGPRFPDMTEAYSAAYRAKAQQVGQQLKIQLDEGAVRRAARAEL